MEQRDLPYDRIEVGAGPGPGRLVCPLCQRTVTALYGIDRPACEECWNKALPAPFVRDSKTSEAAAKAIEPHRATMQAEVLRLLREHPDGMIDQEIQAAMGGNAQNVTPRRIELVKMGRVKDSGRTRPTTSGRQATVWVSA